MTGKDGVVARRPTSRRNRPTPTGTQRPPSRSPAPAGWRATFESFGGFWTLGGGLAIVAILVVMFVAGRGDGGGSDEPFTARERAQTSGRIAGNPDAPVKIVEYGDFQCPFCRRFWTDTEQQLQEEFVDTGIASFEYRDYIIIGPESRLAAEGAACADQQGFFWQMHDVLYLRQGAENSGTFSASNIKKFARQVAEADPSVRLDGDAFDRCLDDHEQRSAVDAMSAEARAAGLSSTPSFIVNGQAASGALTIEQLRTLVNNARGGAR